MNAGRLMAFSCRSASFSYKIAVTEAVCFREATRGGGNTGTEMLKFWAATALVIVVGGQSLAATATNLDSEPRTLLVTEAGNQSELALAAGETVEFCPAGCF